MSDHNWVVDLFTSIDEKDSEKFSSFLLEDCSFQFGNMPAVQGVDAISEFVGGFFVSIDSLKHELSDIWSVPGGVVCHGIVTYTRHDKSQLTIPFSNIFKVDDARVLDYQIFADTSQLYAQ